MTITVKLVPGHKCDVAPISVIDANTIKVCVEEYNFSEGISEYDITEERDCPISSASRDPMTGTLTVAVKRFFRDESCWTVTLPDGSQAGGMGQGKDEAVYDFQ